MRSRSLFVFSIRSLLRRKWQTAFLVLGICLGVAVVIAIDLANTSASRAFTLSTEQVVGRATHQIVGGPSGVPMEVYARLRLESPGIASAPVVEAVVLSRDSAQDPLRILGVDAFREGPFRPFLGIGQAFSSDFARLLIEPDTVIIAQSLAERKGLTAGSTLEIQLGDQLLDLRILGIVVEGEEGAFPEDLLLMDISSAQSIVGAPNSITRVDLIANETQIEALAAELPAGIRVTVSSEQSQTAAELTDAFSLNLTALSLLALVVGMFLIYNTMTFSVLQRRRVLGILRALGVTSRQVFILILVEAASLSAIGALLGLGVGWLLGQGAVRLVTQTINDLYFVLEVQQAPLLPSTAVKGLLLGIGAGVISAIGPGIEAASISPISAMQRSSLEEKVQQWIPWVTLAGFVFLIVGAFLLLGVKDSLIVNFAGMFVIVFGLAFLVPGSLKLLMHLIRILFTPLGGIYAKLAPRTIIRELSRTSVAIAALMIALSVTIGVGIMIESFRSTVVNWLDLSLRADLYVSAPVIGGSGPTGSISADLPTSIEALPGVAAVESLRTVEVPSEFGATQLIVIDGRRARDESIYRFAAGTPEEVWQKVTDGAVVVSEPFAFRNDIPEEGGSITMLSDEGEKYFPIVGVYFDYASDRGAVLMSDRVYRSLWQDDKYTSVGVYLEEEASIEVVQQELRSALEGTGLEVRANRSLRSEAMAIFDRTFAITSALRLLAVIVAFIGIMSALMSLQLERRSELATLRALGVTVRGLGRLTLLESGLMGFAAGLFSLPTGFALALILIYVINLRSFGWTIQMEAEAAIFLQAILLGSVAAILAGIYPLRVISKLEVVDALRGE